MSAFSRTVNATAMTAPGSASEKGKEEGFYCKGENGISGSVLMRH